jgi:hypothetical protein
MEKNFTQIPNEILDNKNLTLEQKALISIFYRNVEGWKMYQKELECRSKNGRDSHVRILKELCDLGFIERVIDGDIRESSTGKFIKGDKYWRLVNTTVDWNPVTGNQELETRNWFTATNNTKQNNTKEIKLKEESVSVEEVRNLEVESGKVEVVKTETETETDSDSNLFKREANASVVSVPMQKTTERNSYFFSIGEKPGFHRIEEYFNSKGYSSRQANDLYKRLIDSDYKDAKGANIKYMDSYIKIEMSKLKMECPSEGIQNLISKLTNHLLSNFNDEDERFMMRIKTTDDVKEFITNQISKRTFEVTEKLINYICKKYSVKSIFEVNREIKNELNK